MTQGSIFLARSQLAYPLQVLLQKVSMNIDQFDQTSFYEFMNYTIFLLSVAQAHNTEPSSSDKQDKEPDSTASAVDSTDKSGDGAPSTDAQVKQEVKLDETTEKGSEESTETAKNEQQEVKTEPVTPGKVKTEPATPVKTVEKDSADTGDGGKTEAKTDAKTDTKTETTGDSQCVKTESEGLDVLNLVDDTTLMNDLDADLISSQGKTSAGTTDDKPKADGQTAAKDAETKTPSADDGTAKDVKDATSTGDDKKVDATTDEKKTDGDDKSKRLVGFVYDQISLASSFDFDGLCMRTVFESEKIFKGQSELGLNALLQVFRDTTSSERWSLILVYESDGLV